MYKVEEYFITCQYCNSKFRSYIVIEYNKENVVYSFKCPECRNDIFFEDIEDLKIDYDNNETTR